MTLYIASENPEDVNQRFKIAIEQCKFAVNQQGIDVLDQSFLLKDRLADLERIIDDPGVVLVIVDTGQAVSLRGGADENSNDGQQPPPSDAAKEPADSAGPLPPPPRETAGADAFRPRGGSSMLAKVDGNIMLSRVESTVTLKSDAGKLR